MRFFLLSLALALTACADPGGSDYYARRCTEIYLTKPGTPEFETCVHRERNTVEETQRRGDRSRP